MALNTFKLLNPELFTNFLPTSHLKRLRYCALSFLLIVSNVVALENYLRVESSSPDHLYFLDNFNIHDYLEGHSVRVKGVRMTRIHYHPNITEGVLHDMAEQRNFT
ncbi:hypothetical protein OIDMADRAFT_16305 [Oidiodendron maius Zn]|uniref:Uncharacterized protein n=1 Tax=Oidiodendron maius (strain Zn) TaxID=913774 RepID=A0A0C3HHR8_OIDMZ|nr:hypothetical protein OIDMADRAFT_16305 [Oidiodendron maius Zn]